MGAIRIRLVHLDFAQGYPTKRRKENIRPGFCRGCGAKLSDAKSIKRGYGPECYERFTAAVLEMIPGGDNG